MDVSRLRVSTLTKSLAPGCDPASITYASGNPTAGTLQVSTRANPLAVGDAEIARASGGPGGPAHAPMVKAISFEAGPFPSALLALTLTK
jgi:hypothetical protein